VKRRGSQNQGSMLLTEYLLTQCYCRQHSPGWGVDDLSQINGI